MKVQANPPRLVQGSEFADILRQARQHPDETQRLEAVGQALHQRLGELSATAAGQGVAAGTLVGKSVGALLVVAVAGAGAVLWSSQHPRRVSAPAHLTRDAELSAAPAAQPPPVAGAMSTEKLASAPAQDSAKPVTPAHPITARHGQSPAPPSASSKLAAPPPPAATGPGEAPSSLPRQLALLEEARAAANAGDYAKALWAVGQLRADFPNSPVLLEARIAEVEYLSLDGQVDAALSALDSLLGARGVTAKRPALLRLQGDLLVKKGECTAAVVAYRHALGLGLADADAAAARRGLQHCARER